MICYIDGWGFIKLNRKKKTFLFLFQDELSILMLVCSSSSTWFDSIRKRENHLWVRREENKFSLRAHCGFKYRLLEEFPKFLHPPILWVICVLEQCCCCTRWLGDRGKHSSQGTNRLKIWTHTKGCQHFHLFLWVKRRSSNAGHSPGAIYSVRWFWKNPFPTFDCWLLEYLGSLQIMTALILWTT